MSGIRLHKYLADAGVASRRKSEELIAEGRVEVDGVVVTTPGTMISGFETVKVDGREVKPTQKKVYILLNKPVGYISSVKDQFSRKTVLDLVDEVKERIYPVGRLDYDTSGLILLTNDGDLANKLTHPKHEINKTYIVETDVNFTEEDAGKLRRGIKVEDYTTAPANVRIIEKNKRKTVVEISIHEGKNRQVRKMFETLGHPVFKLKRIAIGPIGIGSLEEGKWRYLSKNEIEILKKITNVPK